ncbi:MAG: GGDEF domain-containing protein [Chloroflexi bacterium]|nr:GGDEF domain-containing protein [Chloroflexota bacterium]
MKYNKRMNGLEERLTVAGLATLLDHLHAMIAIVQVDGSLVTWNRAFDQCKPARPDLAKLQDFFPEDERIEVQSRLSTNERKRWYASFITVVEHQPVQCDCMLMPISEGQLLFTAERIEADTALSEIVTQLNKQVKLYQVESEVAKKLAHRKHTEVEGVMAQAHELSQMDPLTFLPNRRMMLRELQDEVMRSERYKTQFSISMLDLDHFKQINDTYGHLAGDEVMRQIAVQLRDHIRHPDIAGRFGGEEFLILLPNSDSNAAAEQAARLCRFIREMVMRVNKHVLQITISIGVAELKIGMDTWESLLKRADNAMYEAKSRGRDRWVIAD